VVFYDYDELCPLTDCNFRKLPESQSYDEEMAAEPWFSVRPNDIFPEEFPAFPRLSRTGAESDDAKASAICFGRNTGAPCRRNCAQAIYRKFCPMPRSVGCTCHDFALRRGSE
jgi:hypothetical protein